MKKRVVLFITCLLVIVAFFSCFFLFKTKNIDPLLSYGIVKRINLKYDSIDKFNNIYIVSLNNKYGFLNNNYDVLLELDYDNVSDIGKQYVILEKNGTDYLYDKNGVLVINGNNIELITNVYGADAYYVCNDRCKLYYNQKMIYDGNERIISLVDKYALFDGFLIDVNNGGKIYYEEYYNNNDINAIVLKDNSCLVFDIDSNSWKKYDSYSDYIKIRGNDRKYLEKNYYMDYSSCNGGAYLKKDGKTIIDDCYLYYDISLENENIIIGTNNRGVKVFFENDYSVDGNSYKVIGNYIMIDGSSKAYYDFSGKKVDLSCAIVDSFDDKYICNDGLYQFFVNNEFKSVSDNFKSIDCFDKICVIKNRNNMYAIYGNDYFTDFVYYDYYYEEGFLVGYYINSLDVLALDYSDSFVNKEDINDDVDVYNDMDLINIIYKYDLKSIEDIIKSNRKLFTIYAETAINNQNISEYLDKVLLMFKVVCINKEYLDLDYFIGRLKSLEIKKSNDISVKNAAGVYNKNTNDIKLADDSDRVILHELIHFIDFSINSDMNNSMYNCNDKIFLIQDIDSYKYLNNDNVCEKIDDFYRFVVEAGAEYYTSLYYNKYMVTAYHNYVSVFGLLAKIYGEDKIRECFLAEDGYVKLYELLMSSGLSFKDAKDFLIKISYLTDFNADYIGQYYFDVSDYLVRIIKNDGSNWYDNKRYIYIVRSLLNNVVSKDGLAGIDKYSSYNMNDYKEYCFKNDDFRDVQQSILNKASDLYTIGGVKSTSLVWDDHTYITLTTYYTNYTDWNSALFYVIIDYDFDNDKVNSYKLYPIYG